MFVAGLSLSLFVLGFGLGQFAGGRGSDRLGRRPVLIVALIVYALAGGCCVLATSGGQLATARFIQGLGAGACSVQAFAIVQDLFTGEAARRKQAYVSVVLTTLPMVAPAIGAGIILLLGWRSVHSALMLGGLVLTALVIVYVRESRPQRSLPYSGIGVADSLVMLRDPRFRRIALVNALSYASIFAYISGAPVVIIGQFGFGNAVYAAIFAVTAAALSGGAMTSARLSKRLNCRRLVWPALVLQTTANVALVAAAWTRLPIGEWLLLPLLAAGCFARGIISPNLVHAAVSSHREQAGLAAAIVGLAQLVVAAATSALMARELDRFGVVAIAVAMATLSVGAAALWRMTNLGRLIEQRA